MVSVKVDSRTQWQPGQYGFPEPVSGEASSKGERYDVVVVPLLGFNEQGYRIGYGGGYYDRFLATQPQAKTIGLCYEDGLVSFVPEPHDLPLQAIVTEQTIRKWELNKKPNTG
jgi:5-formyltetrahydrofolate cyclo-ligase